MTRDDIYKAIDLERHRQDRLHPTWPADARYALSVLAEEFGEVAEALNDGRERGLRAELVQVAAVCVRWLESMEVQP